MMQRLLVGITAKAQIFSVKEILEAAENGLIICLFIKKNDVEGTGFYYMGRVAPIKWHETVQPDDKGGTVPMYGGADKNMDQIIACLILLQA